LFLTSPFYYIDRYSDTFGRILGGGVLANDVFEASLIKNFGKLNPLQVRDGAAGEWVAFESGILLAGREFWFGPISYDECNHYSFLVKPNRFRVMTSSDCVLVLNSRFNMEEKLFDTPENVSLKIMANAANIENLAEIFDAVGIPKR
jgi:hypothetical protein